MREREREREKLRALEFLKKSGEFLDDVVWNPAPRGETREFWTRHGGVDDGLDAGEQRVPGYDVAAELRDHAVEGRRRRPDRDLFAARTWKNRPGFCFWKHTAEKHTGEKRLSFAPVVTRHLRCASRS